MTPTPEMIEAAADAMRKWLRDRSFAEPFLPATYQLLAETALTAALSAWSSTTMAKEKTPKTRKWKCMNCGAQVTQFDYPAMTGCPQGAKNIHNWVMREE